MATAADFHWYVDHGEYEGRDWDWWCQAFVWNLCDEYGHAPVIYQEARYAMWASEIVSRDPYAAPPGSFHYWMPEGIPEGHVAIGLGDGECAMAVKEWLLDDVWATNVGQVNVARYTDRIGGYYMGWSYTNGANDVDDMDTARAQSVAPVIERGLFMALTDAQQQELFERIRAIHQSVDKLTYTEGVQSRAITATRGEVQQARNLAASVNEKLDDK